jgi:DNA-binding CsgD family transcriptional regulator
VRPLTLTPHQVRLLERLEAGRSTLEIAEEFGTRQRAIQAQVVSLMQTLEIGNRSELVSTWRRSHEPDHPERVRLPDIGAHTEGARRCTNPECQYGGRWVRGTMVPNQDRKFICVGCYAVYEPRDVIDPENEDYQQYVR